MSEKIWLYQKRRSQNRKGICDGPTITLNCRIHHCVPIAMSPPYLIMFVQSAGITKAKV